MDRNRLIEAGLPASGQVTRALFLFADGPFPTSLVCVAVKRVINPTLTMGSRPNAIDWVGGHKVPSPPS